MIKHPDQPIIERDGVPCFRENRMVQLLLEKRPDLINFIHDEKFDEGDRRQFTQLLGYSLEGYKNLHNISKEEMNTLKN